MKTTKSHLVLIAIFLLFASCKKQDPVYSPNMLLITMHPWRWTKYRVQENNGPWVDHVLPYCVVDNYYTFLPYENPFDVPEVMEINYGDSLCSPDESLDYKNYDYWGFFENETKFKASGWGGTIEPGDILKLNHDSLKVLFTYQDSVMFRLVEITLAH